MGHICEPNDTWYNKPQILHPSIRAMLLHVHFIALPTDTIELLLMVSRQHNQVPLAYTWGVVLFHEKISLLGSLGTIVVLAGLTIVSQSQQMSSNRSGHRTAPRIQQAHNQGTADNVYHAL